MKLGATGEFPRGKFNKDDQGELAIAVYVKDKTIIIEFGKEISWIGMGADMADRLAETIKQKVNLCKGINNG